MQFPITREGLQNFNRDAAQKEKDKQQRYDFYNAIIKHICKDMENIMMTIQIAQNSAEYMLQERMLKDKQYIWKDIRILGHYSTFIHYSKLTKHTKSINPNPIEYYNNPNNPTIRNFEHTLPQQQDFNQSLPEFIEILKETFIGCDIIIDPLKTYLIIDWS